MPKNKKHWLIPTVVLAGIAVILLGYSAKLKNQYDLLMAYCYKVSGFKLKQITKDRLYFSLFVDFENKSSIGMTISSYLFNVSINGKHVGVVKANSPQTINPKGISKLAVDIDVSPEKAFTPEEIKVLAIYALTDKDKIIITIDGHVVAKLGIIGNKSVPVKFSYTLKELLADDPESTQKCNL